MAGSVASLAANVAVAEPTLIGRVIAAWPSFALTASYELLTRQVRRGAANEDACDERPRREPTARPAAGRSAAPGLTLVLRPQRGSRAGGDLQRQTWRWALANRGDGAALPSGLAIALAHGRHERWGRLVKSAGLAGAFGAGSTPQPLMGAQMNREDAQVRPAGDPVTKINGRFSGTVIKIASAGS